MKFIFPQNYNFKNKFLGFIDYSTLFFNLFLNIIIFGILHLIKITIIYKIAIQITFCFPIFLFSILGFTNENIVNAMIYFTKYLIKPKLYLYIKD